MAGGAHTLLREAGGGEEELGLTVTKEFKFWLKLGSQGACRGATGARTSLETPNNTFMRINKEPRP